MNLKKIVNTIALAGMLGSNAYAAKPTVALTRVQKEKPISVVEVMHKPAKNVDFYGVIQHDKDFQFGKARVQYTPINSKPCSLGLALQYENNNLASGKASLGLVGRVQGKIGNKGFGKMDLRYFPKNDVVDTYQFVSTPKLFADCLGKYNTKIKSGFLRPGVDFKLNKRNSIGLEAKLSGKFSKLKHDYVGLRYKVKF